jgi:hypothetical protein
VHESQYRLKITGEEYVEKYANNNFWISEN